MPGTLTVSGMSAGLTSGYKVVGPITITGANPVGEIIDTTLASGDNTFAVPVGATAVLVAFAGGVTATVKLRTNLNSGDTGLPVAPFGGTGWVVFPLVTGVTSLIVNSTASVPLVELSYI